MAGSVNKVTILGVLGRDPEVRSFQNGGKVCSLRVATSETWRDKSSGERKERTEWHAVSIFNENLVSVAERFLRKGSKVYIEGQLETRKYQKDGVDHYATEVVLRPYRGELTLLDNKGGEGGSDFAEPMPVAESTAAAGRRAPVSADMDDEVPWAAEWR